MKQSPYKAWEINEHEFPKEESIEEKIKFLLGYAVLAPSTFNSQPWKCNIIGNNLELYLDTKRMPKISDRTGRFGYISLGCFLENLFLAARAFGFSVNLSFPKKVIKVEDMLLACKAKFIASRNVQKPSLFKEIKNRTTNRSITTTKKISDKLLKSLTRLSNKDHKILILDSNLKTNLIAISTNANKRIWGNFAFRREHIGWVRHNLTRAFDGMPGFGVGLNLFTSLIGKPLILTPIFPKIMIKNTNLALKSSNHFVVICAKSSPLDWIQLGILFEEIALLLSSKGISVSPMGQFIEDDQARGELKKIANVKNGMEPQLFLKIGYPSLKNPHHSPRMPVDKILI